MKLSQILNSTILIIVFMLAALLVLDAAQGEMEFFSEAEGRYYSKNYSLALELYDEFLTRFPLSDLVPDVQYRRAVCLFRLGRFPEAGALFDSIEKRYRATRYYDYVPFWKGVILYGEKDFIGARERLSVFLERVREGELVSQALLYKSLCEVALGNYSEAGESMRRLIDVGGYESLTPYQSVLYSHILLKEKKYQDLIEFQNRIDYRNLPGEWKERALLYRAEAYWNLKDIGRSEEIYEQLIDAYPAAAVTALQRLYIIAQQRQDLKRMEHLIAQAERTFSKDPDILMEFWLQIGIETFNRGELDLSSYFLQKIWNLRSSGKVDEAVPIYLAEISIRKGDLITAKRILEIYRAIYGQESEDVLLHLGAVYLMRDRFLEAAESFARAVGQFPDSQKTEEARYLLAYSQYRLGAFNDALDNCNLLLQGAHRTPYHAQVMRLKVLVLQKMGRLDDSLRTLEEYIALYPDDWSARIDLVKLLFSAKRYQEVVDTAGRFLVGVGREDIESFLLLTYLTGLSQIALKQYEDGLSSLTTVVEEQNVPEKLKQILPYAQYYRGWAAYRLNDFKKSADIFSGFLRSYRVHELSPQALFMNAWCLYTLGDFEKAEQLFGRLEDARDPYIQTRAQFLRAKSLENLKKGPQAARLFQEIFTTEPGSPFADDALFEYAGIMGNMGNIDESAEGYLRLYNSYSQGGLAEEALYKRGEIYFQNNQFEKAKAAFNQYLQEYPGGKLVDAALYWEALSASKIGEKRAAALLWERLISTMKESPFRPDALVKAAEVYEALGEYQRALSFLDDLLSGYPKYAEEVDARLAADRIRYLLYGLSEREAELTARISRSRGAETREGRKAMVELSRLYIVEKQQKLERAFQMLSQVLEKKDPSIEPEAQFLLGEYYYTKKEYETAGKEFFKASLVGSQNGDFLAYTIYRAAQSMKQAGKTREVAELVKRLEENFPESEWSREGKKLLGGKQ